MFQTHNFSITALEFAFPPPKAQAEFLGGALSCGMSYERTGTAVHYSGRAVYKVMLISTRV